MKQKKIVISVTLALGLVQHSAFAQFGSFLELSDINGQNGFTLNGVEAGDFSGRSVSSAGDVNGDGIDDLIIGADRANSFAGSSYVVFGSSSGLPHPFNLSTLNGSNGFTLNGVTASDSSGRSVSSAGDVNGDNIDDLIIGAFGADPDNINGAGSSYVVFGSSSGFPHPFNLADLNGSNGFVINGVVANDFSGFSVSAAGDVNNDGRDDLIISAHRSGGNNLSGSSYVVFGSANPPNPFDLIDINGVNGFTLNGANGDQSSVSVSTAGDVNDDHIDDVIISAYGADPNGNINAGSSYVAFGSNNPSANPLDLSTLNGSNGFTINGVFSSEQAGASVSSAGDVNGDGIDDVIIGAKGTGVGKSYVVFGSNSGLPHPFDLSSLDGTNGIVLIGVTTGVQNDVSVSSAGDVNGDGIDDVIIGFSGVSSGRGNSYVVFGSTSPFSHPFGLSTLDGLNGFTIGGMAAGDEFGGSVSAAGDINGDGIDDVIIGANYADPDANSNAGSSYVVFGNDVIFKDGFE